MSRNCKTLDGNLLLYRHNQPGNTRLETVFELIPHSTIFFVFEYIEYVGLLLSVSNIFYAFVLQMSCCLPFGFNVKHSTLHFAGIAMYSTYELHHLMFVSTKADVYL